MRVGDLDTGEQLLTAEQAAARLGWARRTLLSYIADDRAERAPQPAVYMAGRPLWSEADVEEWAAG